MRARNKRFIILATQTRISCDVSGWDPLGVSVSNPTNQYLFFPSINDWIAPQSRGTFALGGEPTLPVEWGAPPGIVQPAAVTAPVPQQASIVLTDQPLPNAGGPITFSTSITVGATVTTCRVYSSVNIAIPSGVYTTVALDSERYDVDNLHDNAVNNTRITLNKTGIWSAGACVTFAAAVGGSVRAIEIGLNGFARRVCDHQQAPVAGGVFVTINSLQTEFSAIAGDYLELRAYQDTGAPLNLNTNAEFGIELWASFRTT